MYTLLVLIHSPPPSCLQMGVSLPPNTAGIVTRPNVLLTSAKNEVLELMKTVLDKCSSQVSVQLLDVRRRYLILLLVMCTCYMQVVDIVLFCLDQDELKKKNYLLNELFPSLTRYMK